MYSPSPEVSRDWAPLHQSRQDRMASVAFPILEPPPLQSSLPFLHYYTKSTARPSASQAEAIPWISGQKAHAAIAESKHRCLCPVPSQFQLPSWPPTKPLSYTLLEGSSDSSSNTSAKPTISKQAPHTTTANKCNTTDTLQNEK